VKLLHVSDWHLGRTTYRKSRADDHDVVLAEMIRIAAEQRPDVILHTGDLFDVVRPGYTDMTRGVTALQELGAVAPVVVLCGNHDSPALFDLLDQLVGAGSRIRFVSKARTPEDGGVLCLPAADGSTLRLASLPFVHANRMLDGFEDGTTWHALYTDRVHVVEASLARGLLDGFDTSRDVAVFAAHLHVGGAVLSGSERRVHVGDSYASHLEHIPAVSYAAFGHIHKPQPLPGTVQTGTYAGSPIQLDFGELGELKRVVLVEARPGKPAQVTSIPLSGGRPLWRFDGTLEELTTKAPQAGRCLALVTVRTETATPGLHLRVQELLPAAVCLDIHEVPTDRLLPTLAVDTSREGPEPGIEEIFRSYLAEVGTRGSAADRVMTTFSMLVQAVESEQLVRFPEEDELQAPSTVSGHTETDRAVPTASTPSADPDEPRTATRTATCRSCGRNFDSPVKRGRPPTVCQNCR
jgi:exonuclease SbcD